MERRPLGDTGLHLSTIGLGTWAIGGQGWRGTWGAQDDGDSIAAIRAAVEAGVNWIDTAAVYGLGHAEEVVAEALAALPPADRPFVFTKCGRRAEGGPTGTIFSDLRAESIRAECEDSLRRLRVERIDVYQIHHADPNVPIDEAWATMLALADEGKIGVPALCNQPVDGLAACAKVAPVPCHQLGLSIADRAAADAVAWCADNNTAVVCHSPLHHGVLSDRFSAERVEQFAPDDWRRRSPDFSGEGLDASLALHARLQAIARDAGLGGVLALAVGYVLSWPGVTGAIVGARHPDQVASWAGAGAPLADDVFALATEAADAFRRS